MQARRGRYSPRSGALTVASILAMIVLPAALTLSRVRVSAVVDVTAPNPSPYGYTVSLLLFIVPILAIGLWLVPADHVVVSKKSFVRTLALLVPSGFALDFLFSHLFLTFPNPRATLGIPAPVLGASPGSPVHIFVGSPGHIVIGSVPIEEYFFYLTGFTAVLLLYIWLDEYWLAAYSVPGDAPERINFQRLLQFHPQSLLLAVALIVGAILYRHYFAPHPSGFPGYFTYLVAAALGPSTAIFPAALPVINWRALSLTLFVTLLTSLLWEATLAVPYGWWGYQPDQMVGIGITAWNYLPIEAICVWMSVTYQTVIVYETVKRWQSSGKKARHAFLG
jgi:hypothetical protein